MPLSLDTTPVKVIHAVESKERGTSKSQVMKVEREIGVEEERATWMMAVKVCRGAEEEDRGTTSTTLVKVIGRGVHEERRARA
jgi:hypothetical protein